MKKIVAWWKKRKEWQKYAIILGIISVMFNYFWIVFYNLSYLTLPYIVPLSFYFLYLFIDTKTRWSFLKRTSWIPAIFIVDYLYIIFGSQTFIIGVILETINYAIFGILIGLFAENVIKKGGIRNYWKNLIYW